MALIPQKISERTPAGAITGAELVPIVQGGADVVATVEEILDSRSQLAKTTDKGGFAILKLNKTGADSVKGQSVACSTATAQSVMINPIDGDMPIGVMLDSGVPDGSLCWVVISGPADVLFKNGVAPILGGVIYSSSVAGRVDIASSVPTATVHFRELGHCFEAKSAGTDVLAECTLHFN